MKGVAARISYQFVAIDFCAARVTALVSGFSPS